MESPSFNATSSFINASGSSSGDAADVKPWVLAPAPHKAGEAVHACGLSTQEGEARMSEAKGQPLLHSEFVVSKQSES